MQIIHIEYNGSSNNFIIGSKGFGNIIINSSLGAKCLYHLINNENRSFKPTVLRNIIENKVDISPQAQRSLNITNKEELMLFQALNTFIPATDMKTIFAIKKRKSVLEQELLEAQDNNDLKRIDDLITEKEALESYLVDSLSMNGAIRNLNSNIRKATKSIARAIDLSLNEIADKSEAIYKILKKKLIISTNQVKFTSSADSKLLF